MNVVWHSLGSIRRANDCVTEVFDCFLQLDATQQKALLHFPPRLSLHNYHHETIKTNTRTIYNTNNIQSTTILSLLRTTVSIPTSL